MLFSVVIPTFNRRELLRRTLESLRAQTFTDYETIVVDDGSTDGTREYLKQHEGILRAIYQSNAGPGAARNTGAAQARGRYLAFLDSDDLWFPWTLATFAKVIEAGAPALLVARYFDLTDERQLLDVRETGLQHRRFDDYFSSSRHPIAVGSNTLVVERSTFLASGGFTDRLINGEDIDLVLRLGEARGFAQVLEPMTLAWRRHDASVTAILPRSIAGMSYLIEQERSGNYPGGRARARERHRLITRHVRPISFACLRAGRLRDAMQLYRSTLRWHGSEGRWAYVGAFPLYWAGSAVRMGWRR